MTPWHEQQGDRVGHTEHITTQTVRDANGGGGTVVDAAVYQNETGMWLWRVRCTWSVCMDAIGREDTLEGAKQIAGRYLRAIAEGVRVIKKELAK